jgi:hypothetical protein
MAEAFSGAGTEDHRAGVPRYYGDAHGRNQRKAVKKMKNHKLLSLVIALAFVFSAMGLAFAPQSMAATPGEYLEGSAIPPAPARDTSTYVIASPDYAKSINVTFVIEAGNEFNEEEGMFRAVHDVELSTASGYYTVTDLLVAVNGDSSYNLSFFGVSEDQFIPITDTTDFVGSVQYMEIKWEYDQLGYDGWAFRVNDKYPVFYDGTGYIGANILQTNIKDGDVVHMFYDFPADFGNASGSFAANYVRGVSLDFGGGSLTVQLQGHTTYIYPLSPYTLYVDNYKNVQAGVSADIYDFSTRALIGSTVSDVNGRVTFSGLSSGTMYIVMTDSVYYPGYSIIPDDTYFALTGAYFKVVTP